MKSEVEPTDRLSDYLVAVTLYIQGGRELEFHDFETRALALVVRHGGELVRAVRLSNEPRDEAAPYEFHLLAFPSKDAFETFMADPERAQLREFGAMAICKTELIAGFDCSEIYRQGQ